MATVSLVNLQKSYNEFHAVKGIDLEIRDHEFVVFVGPSGCGKSTTLRMIAGLEDISAGDLMIGGRRVNDLGPAERDIAMVFQNYALYPHMTVRDNISFGLRQKKMPKDEIDRRVDEASRMLGLETLLKLKPRMLSGGQRQRVAMGRAMVRNPAVFLFDEPLSNLDAKLRVQMRAEIKQLHQQIPTTTVYVTHDQIEAMTMADRIVVMNGGLVEQVGPPQELYSNPASLFVAEFIGSPSMNILPAKISAAGDDLIATLADGTAITLPAERRAAYGSAVGREMLFGIRPEAMGFGDTYAGQAKLTVSVDYIEPLGAETLMFFSLGGRRSLCARAPGTFRAAHGAQVTLHPDLTRMHLIDPDSKQVLPWHA